MSPKSEKKPTADKSKVEAPKEKFWRVTFSHRQNTNETTDVILSVNGDQIVIKRGEEVVIPDRYKEVADHGTYQNFTQLPGVDRKVTGTVMVYPYILHGPATEAEFRKMYADGNKMAQDAEKIKQQS